MLSTLSIRDIILIERLDINFSFGLSIFTGETGAGKSIILDSISFVLGARGDSKLVRLGKKEGHVVAVFDLPLHHIVYEILKKNSIPIADHLILKRVQMIDGKTRGFVNDVPVSRALMQTIGRILVEVHGQHSDRDILDSGFYRSILDSFGSYSDALEECRVCWKNWRSAQDNLFAYQKEIKKSIGELDYLRFVLEELQELDPKEGEESYLAGIRIDLMNTEKIAGDVQDFYTHLSQNSALRSLISSLRRLERKEDLLPLRLKECIHSLDEAFSVIDTAQIAIEHCMHEICFDAKKLDEIENRLFALRAAARKHKVSGDELHILQQKILNQIEHLDMSQEHIKTLEEQVQIYETLYDKAAKILSSHRHDTAKSLRSSVMGEFRFLKFETADFLIDIVSDPLHRMETGIDCVDFKLSTNSNTSYGSLIKIASGGELSRFFLALKVALSYKISFSTLIFDEIDTGVSGAVADAIGERLSLLSQSMQIFSVTHSPQVAAFADTHFLVSKSFSDTDDSYYTKVHAMSELESQEEIARMLSGAEITQEARAAALKLLDKKRKSFH